MADEFIKKDGKIIVNSDVMYAYIPLSLFDDERLSIDIVHSAVASSFGDGFKVIGAFNIRCANGENAEAKIEESPVKTFIYPVMIETYPSGFVDKEIKMPGDETPEKYRVFKYVKGDIMMNAFIKRDSDHCVKFLDVLNKGKIPKTIAYPNVYNAWVRNIEINDVDPDVPYMILQYIIAVLYKRKANIAQPFRYEYGKDMSSNAYYATNIRGSVASSSVFANQTFEHMSRMLGNAVNISRRDLPQEPTPIEKTLYL